jgi:hypothetical protein
LSSSSYKGIGWYGSSFACRNPKYDGRWLQAAAPLKTSEIACKYILKMIKKSRSSRMMVGADTGGTLSKPIVQHDFALRDLII